MGHHVKILGVQVIDIQVGERLQNGVQFFLVQFLLVFRDDSLQGPLALGAVR